MLKKLLAVSLLGLLSCGVFANETADTGMHAGADMLMADNNRQERRGGRQDNRDDKQDCRQEEGRVSDDKRDCKQDSRGGEDDGAEADGAESDA